MTKKEQKLPWLPKTGVLKLDSRFPNNVHEAFLFTNEEISQEKISTFKKNSRLLLFQKLIIMYI
jgi:hypothetical protein